MNQPRVDLLTMVKPVERRDPYETVQNRIKIKTLNREDETAQKKAKNAEVAVGIFSKKGLSEESIKEYEKATGDVETAQGLLSDYQTLQKEKQYTENLNDIHLGNMLEHATKQDEVVDDTYKRASAFFSQLDLNDNSPENMKKINSAWQFYRQNEAPHMAVYDDKNNIVRGINMPENPDLNFIANIIQRGKDHETLREENKLKLEEYLKNKELNIKARDVELKGAKEGTKVYKEDFKRENALRTQYNSLSRDFTKVRDSYSKIKKVAEAENPTSAADLSIIFNYMKMLDPTSVVRESEYASAEKARGVPETIRNTYNKVMKGNKLGPDQRADFIAMAEELYSEAEKVQNELKENYSNIAKLYNIDPGRVTATIPILESGTNKQDTTPDEDELFDELFPGK